MRTLVLGGIRSGKSARAEALLSAAPRVRYLATGAMPGSDDAAWAHRIHAHRARRGDRYDTIETLDLAAHLRADPSTPTLVDDLGNWVTRLLDEAGWDRPDIDLAGQIADLAAAVTGFRGDLVIVSPEVGLSVVPSSAAGRRFADVLGAATQALATTCENVELIVAGRVFTPTAYSEGVVSTRSARSTDDGSPPATPHAAPPPATPHETSPPTTPHEASPPATPHAAPPPATPHEAPPPTTPHEAPPLVEPVRNAVTSRVETTTPAEFPLNPIDAEIFDVVPLPDDDVAEQTRQRLLTLTKPPGSLGRLEDLGVWIASCQGTCPPRRIESARIAVFAGDHGVARDGVSAFPPEVTAQMVANIVDGGAAINVLARRAGATVQVLDMSVDTDGVDPVIARYKVRRGTGDLRRGEAMTLADARRSIAAGRAVADELIDAGADLLIAGDMGIGNTTPAAVLTGVITGEEPVVVVGRGTGIDDASWIRKTAAIRDGMRFGRPHRHDPVSLLAAVAGPDLAAMAGFLAQSALRKTPAILDGMVVTSAALVADVLAPGARAWWCAGHRSTEPAHGFALTDLGLEPILELSMRLGEGSGAATALPVVADAVDLLIDMATFGEAGVTDGS